MISVTITVDRQDLIELGVSGDGEDVECLVNEKAVSFLYPSFYEGKAHMGTKIHFFSGENIWCYDSYETLKEKLA